MKKLSLIPGLLCLLVWSCSNTSSQAQVQMPANTELRVAIEQDLDGAKVKDGDTFRATIAEPVVWEGKLLVPKGAECKGHIVNKQTAQSQGSSGVLSLVLDSIHTDGHSYNVKTGPQTFGSTPIAQSAGDMARGSEVAAPVRKALENALITRNTVMRFLTQEPVNVSVPNQKS